MKRLQSTLQQRRLLWVQAFSGFLVWLGRPACTRKLLSSQRCNWLLLTRELRQPPIPVSPENALWINRESTLSPRLPVHGKRQRADTKYSHPPTHPTAPHAITQPLSPRSPSPDEVQTSPNPHPQALSAICPSAPETPTTQASPHPYYISKQH